MSGSHPAPCPAGAEFYKWGCPSMKVPPFFPTRKWSSEGNHRWLGGYPCSVYKWCACIQFAMVHTPMWGFPWPFHTEYFIHGQLQRPLQSSNRFLVEFQPGRSIPRAEAWLKQGWGNTWGYLWHFWTWWCANFAQKKCVFFDEFGAPIVMDVPSDQYPARSHNTSESLSPATRPREPKSITPLWIIACSHKECQLCLSLILFFGPKWLHSLADSRYEI